MAQPNRDAAIAEFKRIFWSLAPYRHRYEVFRDFVTMAACALHNNWLQDEDREKEYFDICSRYEKADQDLFRKLLAQLRLALDDEPRDVLGSLYMDLEIGNKHGRQFFTPPEISDMSAMMTFQSQVADLKGSEFLIMADPIAGAGGTILSAVKQLTEAGYNPARTVWVQAIDIDRTAALMCYVQFALWKIPAEVIVRDMLSQDIREVWYTPQHHIGLWKFRLHRKQDSIKVFSGAAEKDDPASVHTSTQLGFDF